MNLQTIAAFLAASSQYLGLPSSEPGAQTVELFEQIGHQRRQFGYGLEVALQVPHAPGAKDSRGGEPPDAGNAFGVGEQALLDMA